MKGQWTEINVITKTWIHNNTAPNLVQHLEISFQNIEYSKLQQGQQAQLIVALNLFQHVKYLSEISAVFEMEHGSIFTLLQSAACPVIPAAVLACWQINVAQITAKH